MLRSHTHCQVAQADAPRQEHCSKLKERMTEMNEHQAVTKCKCHKGFSGLRRSEVRFNFSYNLIVNHPQSLTALTLNR